MFFNTLSHNIISHKRDKPIIRVVSKSRAALLRDINRKPVVSNHGNTSTQCTETDVGFGYIISPALGLGPIVHNACTYVGLSHLASQHSSGPVSYPAPNNEHSVFSPVCISASISLKELVQSSPNSLSMLVPLGCMAQPRLTI